MMQNQRDWGGRSVWDLKFDWVRWGVERRGDGRKE